MKKSNQFKKNIDWLIDLQKTLIDEEFSWFLSFQLWIGFEPFPLPFAFSCCWLVDWIDGKRIEMKKQNLPTNFQQIFLLTTIIVEVYMHTLLRDEKLGQRFVRLKKQSFFAQCHSKPALALFILLSQPASQPASHHRACDVGITLVWHSLIFFFLGTYQSSSRVGFSLFSSSSVQNTQPHRDDDMMFW